MADAGRRDARRLRQYDCNSKGNMLRLCLKKQTYDSNNKIINSQIEMYEIY